MKKYFTILFTLLIFFIPEVNAQGIDSWNINGQIQLRTELDGRDFSNRTHPLTFASLRTRLAVEKSFDDALQFYVQLQDSRVFGEEPSTLSAIDNIDLHQGFVKLNKPFGWDFSVQAGRFEVKYGTERFFGAVGWHYVGRSFDGVRFNIAPDCFDLDLFALTIDESNSYIGNAVPSIYPYPQVPTPSESVYGFWKKTDITNESELDLFGYYQVDRTKIAPDTCRLNFFTLGATYWGNYGNFSTIVEGAFQFGDVLGDDLSAYLISLQGTYKTGIAKFGAGADILSGTDPEESEGNNTFRPSFGTNHKFYGYMDYFINIPVNTFNLGLNDFYLMANIQPDNSKFNFDAKFHLFMSNKSVDVVLPGETEITNTNSFGQELDLTVKYNFVKGTTVSWGTSFFFQGDLMKVIFDPRDDTAFWTYLMVSTNIN